jgi:hypothetical protein
VLQSVRKRHQDVQERTVNVTVSSKGGDVDHGRHTVEWRGGGGPAS